MFAYHLNADPVELAFTDRLGGVSASPYDALNLARTSGDDPAAVATNWARVLDVLAPDGAVLCDMQQVHGNVVAVADPAAVEAPVCDAIVTDRSDVVLAVRVADCVPVLLADPAAGVIGATHAGRKGVELDVVGATVDRMRELGATALAAWIGPHVCGGCYEVPQQMQDEVAAIEPATRATTTWGTPSLDLGAGVRAQLERAGVAVTHLGPCTLEHTTLFSHRRDAEGAGRLAGLIRVRR
ncbi:peptidoglycan editing factor PgeF [Nocardioides jiangxiensis]|uniref:Purine nucleoside phosphorylase n=1 Tax=Nocardioides jiangxiensis TaxID=3064524 RepID=A0ABT9B3C6_9ACTN|nr:peptidoglycan editing factor PgeF [Nocardioides sp. WY-20]MDO7869351.1 peptidoglycan editing factor PgeF [Nocardioides sp. WY-20]